MQLKYLDYVYTKVPIIYLHVFKKYKVFYDTLVKIFSYFVLHKLNSVSFALLYIKSRMFQLRLC